MPKFDWEALVKGQQQSGNLLTAIGKGYGAPTCLTNLVGEGLALIPMPGLQAMHEASETAQGQIDAAFDSMSTWLSTELGINITITPNGEISVTSRNSKIGKEIEGQSWFEDLVEWTNALGNTAGTLYGAFQRGRKEWQNVSDCVKTFVDGLKHTGTTTSEPAGARSSLTESQFDDLINQKYGPKLIEITNINAARARWKDLQNNIEQEILNRMEDPLLEPEFIKHVPGKLFRIAGVSGPPEEEEIIRLVFGPPIAVEGQFIASEDGLYYDSQSSGVSGVTKVLQHVAKKRAEVDPADRWKHSFDPNLGGKGVQISSKTVNQYVDTIFDPNIINERSSLRKHYEADHYLQNLEGQKSKRVYDISGQIAELEASGVAISIIQNTRQGLYSDISLFEEKINKRKKQIEIAIDIPSLYGNTSLFLYGEVPLNDFTYLQQFNFATSVRKQKALVLDQKDISGSVLPYPLKFVTSEPNNEFESADHIFVSEIGKGEIFYSNSVTSIVAPQLSITDQIVSNNLFALYNYLETNVVSPSSQEFNVTNCAVDKVYNNGQLVAEAASSVFFSGLSVPYLTGVTKQVDNHPYYASSPGIFCRTADGIEFQDLTYSKDGFTFETWMHVPYLTDVKYGWGEDSGDTSGYYRLVLANENTGIDPGITAQTNPERLDLDLGDGIVKGMIMGFTRDIRLTKNSDYSDTREQNLPSSSLAFFAAPTQSINAASAGLISISGCSNSSPGWYSFTVDASTATPGGNQYLLSSADKYIHVVLTANPEEDKMSLYTNGELLTTSTLTCFGRDKYDPLSLPSFVKTNSHNYVASSVGASATAELKAGPRLGAYFTPWILGGGYTDGIAGTGFMGNHTFGATSGLRGHLGSTKFYSRVLDAGEVLKNYNAQKGVFENIKTTETYNKGKYQR